MLAVRTKKFVPKPADSQVDPRFQKVKTDAEQKAKLLKKHPTAKSKSGEAAKAAKGAPNEKIAGAKSNQVDSMKDAKAEAPEADSFLTVLRAEIEKVMPANAEEAGDFMKGAAESEMKAGVGDNVKAQKDTASADLQGASDAAPNTNAVPAKEVAAIPPDPNQPALSINGAAAMPAPLPDSDISQKQTKTDADQQLKENKLTTKRLANKDQRFAAVTAQKSNVDRIADASPNKFRQQEKVALAKAGAQAGTIAKTGLSAVVSIKNRSKSAVKTRQSAQKEKDEQRRKVVTDKIEGFYAEAKQLVDKNLSGLERDVMAIFDAGASSAIANLKSSTNRQIDKFYDERYSGIRGAARWLVDKFRPAPAEVKQIIAANIKSFGAAMDALAVRVAGLVDRRLKQAKTDVDKGQAKIKVFVQGLPRDLQSVGRQAESQIAGRFDEMRSGIEAKKNDLAQKLAAKYKEAHDKAQEFAKKVEAENAGAFAGLIAAIGEVIKIILEFKDKLMALLRKAADTIDLILDDPIGFLGNLIAAIKAGVGQFVGNIWTHLKAGFMKWLFGALSGAGIEIPADLSPASIFKLVLSVLGITVPKMRAKAVKLLGPTAVAVIEKMIEYAGALISGGPAKLWEQIKADIGDLKTMVIGAIQDWLVDTIIKQATVKLLSFFNPAGAFVQAVLAIYNLVMFLIERASQIMAFVEAVINSVSSIAQGAIGAAANWIEQALARMIPLVIGFLARLIGLGNISQKIKEFITKVQGKVDGAIDKALAKIAATVKKLFGKMTAKSKKDDKRTDQQKVQDLGKALRETNHALKDEGRRKPAEKQLARIKKKYNLTAATIVVDEQKKGTTFFHADLEINPIAKSDTAGEMDFIEPAIVVDPPFFCKKSLDAQEFKAQLALQESTMNAMNVHEWLTNRRTFVKKGRSKEGTKVQRQVTAAAVAAFRAKVIADRMAVYQAEPHKMTAPQALSKAEGFTNRLLAYTTKSTGLRTYKISQMTDRAHDGKTVQNEIFGKAALHALDQVAGGSGTEIAGLGGAREDFSLGAAWNNQGRIQKLEAKVKKEIKGKKADEQKNIRMAVKLPATYE